MNKDSEYNKKRRIRLEDRKKSLIGQKFYRLTVLSNSETDKHKMLCSCECGNEKEIFVYNLNGGSNTKSCGCLHREHAKNHPSFKKNKAPGQGAKMALICKYRHSAKSRNLEYSLTMEEFEKITKSNCSYCGLQPQAEYDYGHNTGNYIYNGIDRVDSSKGYTKENSTACCYTCNIAKSDMHIDEFKDWVKRVYNVIKNT
jgi:hypothetical protein